MDPAEPEASADGDSGTAARQSISMHDFLDFLKLSCQVQDQLIQSDRSTPPQSGIRVNLNELAQNPLVNSLLSRVAKPHLRSPKQRSCDSSGSPLSGRVCRDPSTKAAKPKLRQSSRKSKESPALHPALEHKLNEVIDEGILDSVLQYMCPPAAPAAPAAAQNASGAPVRTTDQPPSSSSSACGPATPATAAPHAPCEPRLNVVPPNREPTKYPRRKSIPNQPSGDQSVTIHVCDELKHISRDFQCPQAQLCAAMGYFADVTAGQRLEDMDISVHCDVQIFEWLMRWVKRDQLAADAQPLLDAANVVPILVSATFLQMEPLLCDCLAFCHAHLSDVVRAAANTACLNDTIVGRLAAMFTNLELEAVRDKRERVTPRLWCKLIQSLAEPEAQQLRGHYATLADLFRCARCGQYLTQAVTGHVHCTASNMRLTRWGQLVARHQRDAAWSLGNCVQTLYRELRSWRRVYWRLWGVCHHLYCAVCERHFPVAQMRWCRYHPEPAQFLGPATEGRMAGPAGRWPCCQQQAFRYEALAGGQQGCQFREHTVLVETDRDRAVLKLFQLAEEGGCLHEPVPTGTTTTTGHQLQLQNGEQWWYGVQLMPSRSTVHGLLPSLSLDAGTAGAELHGRACDGRAGRLDRGREASEETAEESSSDTDSCALERFMRNQTSTTGSSDGYESDSSAAPAATTKSNKPGAAAVAPTATVISSTAARRSASIGTSAAAAASQTGRKRAPKLSGRHWSSDVSARSNQDHQREFEERAMRQVVAMVGKRTGSDTNVRQHQYHQQGGVYVRLEAEWRDSLRQKLSAPTVRSVKK